MKQKWFSLFPLIALFVMLAVPQTVSAINEEDVQAMLNTLNDRLAAAGENFRVAYVDFQTVDEIGIRVYAKDHEHRLSVHWLPYDPWRWGAREIFWLIDDVDRTDDVPWEDATAAIGRAMNTWNTVPCANIPLVQWPHDDIDWGIYQYWYWFDPAAGEEPGHNGGSPFWMADLTHAGWLPRDFFDFIWPPDGGDYVLGVTFTFTWTARPDDVAFKEIYYNDEFQWNINAHYDIECVALHEVGHGLSLGHFGMIFRDAGTGKLRFVPNSVMNAIYYYIKHDLFGIDNASFCGIWSSWPNN